jgi:hypothetical protein
MLVRRRQDERELGERDALRGTPGPATTENYLPLIEGEEQCMLLLGRRQCGLVNEHHVSVLGVEQEEVEVARGFERLAENFVQSGLHLHADDMGDCGFPAARRPDHEGVVHRSVIGLCGVQCHPNLLDNAPLSHEPFERRWPAFADFRVLRHLPFSSDQVPVSLVRPMAFRQSLGTFDFAIRLHFDRR